MTDLSPKRLRRALLAVGAQFWVNGMVYASVVPRLPEIRDQVGASNATLGLALTLASLGGLAGSLGASSVVQRLGGRVTILIGTAIMLVVLPLVSVAGSVVALALVLGVIALTDVVVDIGMNLQGSWLSTKRRANNKAPVMNRLHGLWSLGSVVGGLIAAQAAASRISLTLHLVIVAVSLAVFEVVVGIHLLGRSEGTETVSVDRQESIEADNASVEATGSADKRNNFTARTALVLAVLGAAAIAIEVTPTDWASFRLAEDLAVGSTQFGLGFVAFTTGMVVGRFSGDALEARLGTLQLVRSAALLAGAGLAAATLVPNNLLGPSVELGVTLAGYFVAALGVSVVFPQLYDAAAKAPGDPGRGLGAMTAGSRLATLGSPVMVGVLADTQLTVGAAVALVALPGCVFIFFLRTENGQPNGSP